MSYKSSVPNYRPSPCSEHPKLGLQHFILIEVSWKIDIKQSRLNSPLFGRCVLGSGRQSSSRISVHTSWSAVSPSVCLLRTDHCTGVNITCSTRRFRWSTNQIDSHDTAYNVTQNFSFYLTPFEMTRHNVKNHYSPLEVVTFDIANVPVPYFLSTYFQMPNALPTLWSFQEGGTLLPTESDIVRNRNHL